MSEDTKLIVWLANFFENCSTDFSWPEFAERHGDDIMADFKAGKHPHDSSAELQDKFKNPEDDARESFIRSLMVELDQGYDAVSAAVDNLIAKGLLEFNENPA